MGREMVARQIDTFADHRQKTDDRDDRYRQMDGQIDDRQKIKMDG